LEEELCNSKDVWAKAQHLSENHTYSLGNMLYAFPKESFFKQNYTEVTKEILELNLFANKYSKTLIDYKNRKCLWIYNNRTKVKFLFCFK